MPIRVQDELPAVNFLRDENVFVMTTSRATGQEIRPLKVLILNLMPKKIETENQFLRLLSNSPLQVDIKLLRIDARESRNTPWNISTTSTVTLMKSAKRTSMV
jgi:homoserine O-succinyltransferase